MKPFSTAIKVETQLVKLNTGEKPLDPDAAITKLHGNQLRHAHRTAKARSIKNL